MRETYNYKTGILMKNNNVVQECELGFLDCLITMPDPHFNVENVSRL